MAFQLSPGVLVVEKDLTNVVPAVATSIGGFVGDFQWGPVLEPTTISSEIELVKTFGKPNDTTFASFFSAANFLSYSNNLKVVRAVGSAARNAVASGTAVQIQNAEQWEASYASASSGEMNTMQSLRSSANAITLVATVALCGPQTRRFTSINSALANSS